MGNGERNLLLWACLLIAAVVVILVRQVWR